MAKLMARALGEIVSVLMRAPAFRHLFLTDLEWMVLPAIASRQFALAQVSHKESGLAAPIAVLMWASVSEEVDARLTSNLGQPMRLKPSEWTGGSIAWLVEAVGDLRAVQTLIEQTLAGPLKGRTLKVTTRNAEGKPAVQILSAADAPPKPDPASTSH
jgi:cytolysin-activating lysine-acyltransferase